MFPIQDENQSDRRPFVTYTLIAINAIIFIGTLVVGNFDRTINDYGLRPAELFAGQKLYTLLTSIFMHGGFLHIIFNMLYLWVFGDNVEDALGHAGFLLFYLGTGLAASLVHALSDPASMIPTIGASGAIAGVLGAYFVLYPWAKVRAAVIFFYIIRVVMIPAILLIGVWFVLQFISASLTWVTGASSGVAYWAHIGGFIAGVFLILPVWFKRRKNPKYA